MIDGNFYEKIGGITLRNICDILSIEIPVGYSPDIEIRNIARLDNASESDLTFFHNVIYTEELSKTKAFACLVAEKHAHLVPNNVVALSVLNPYLALGILLKELYSIKSKHDRTKTFISDKASISRTAVIGTGCYISDFAVIDDEVTVGDGTFIGSNVSILRGVEVGENSHIESNTTISFAKIGKFAYIKTGSRIGQQGFGFHIGETGIVDIMQLGRVIIGNNVQIGANCTIDRGSMDDTVIGNDVRIDDMVHIAHNVEIGDRCVIAAQTGISGSVTIGSRCFLGGQVGIAGHLKIGNNVSIAAQSGIMKNLKDNCRMAGSPAVSIFLWHRQNICLKKMVENRGQD
ncbi:MAG: UDP-3-O-(3-hydroxymyristoyl)glucosamine N-acyltransferase [Holosporales bacterium]|jgi:UDP-3-O-[3-hydroxymyristoyl] glucosamine N-acyltransferase|nr:UDP-3-O-(3-hydroxymyristoyl)glucosamine N-acyltransferase [Holosporales bacterium]